MENKTIFVVAGKTVLFLVGLLLLSRGLFGKKSNKLEKSKTKTYVVVLDKEKIDEYGYEDRIYDKFNEVEKQLRKQLGHECYIKFSKKEIEIIVNNSEISEEECYRIIDEIAVKNINDYYYYIISPL